MRGTLDIRRVTERAHHHEPGTERRIDIGLSTRTLTDESRGVEQLRPSLSRS
jgi:hypothetical protein